MLYRGNVATEKNFDKIIKLSYRHYLCQNQNQYAIYRFNNIGYENVRGNSPFVHMLTIQFRGELNLNALLTRLSQNYPNEFEDISKLITPYSVDRYLSEFNHFSAVIDDVHLSWAVQRVIMNNDFSTTELDIKYGALAS